MDADTSSSAFDSGPLRVGTWTEEERAYMNALMGEFKEGSLNLDEGTTMRGFLAKQLHCGVKRISKKMEGFDYKGRHSYCPHNNTLSPQETTARRERVKVLRSKFLESLEKLRLPGSKAYKEEQAKKDQAKMGKKKAPAMWQPPPADPKRERANLLEAIGAAVGDDALWQIDEPTTTTAAAAPSLTANDNHQSNQPTAVQLERKQPARRTSLTQVGLDAAAAASSVNPSLLSLGITNLPPATTWTANTNLSVDHSLALLRMNMAAQTTANQAFHRPSLGRASLFDQAAAMELTQHNQNNSFHPLFGNNNPLNYHLNQPTTTNSDAGLFHTNNPTRRTSLAQTQSAAGMTPDMVATTRLCNPLLHQQSLANQHHTMNPSAAAAFLGMNGIDEARKLAILRASGGVPTDMHRPRPCFDEPASKRVRRTSGGNF
ncbi:expressed unknown protein [Seminavis robusta]|uniref:Uncharacterized protein n=1 Tax=Seminavis robusta TaxID=568900 RepID=A0A9N8HDE4_9STRA|nr:expressed unknown protein [Seminavis robusta]|eukprot:Sro356_g125440.1 n/a (431) ;mRNA; f:59603-60895